MLNSKKIFVLQAVVIACLLTSCMEQKMLFSFNDAVKNSFFRNMPGIGKVTFLSDSVTAKATSIQVYKSSFSEKYIEKEHLLDITELNDSTKINYADYWDVHGYSQEMYLLKYVFAARPARKPNARSHPVNAMLFFSVKYNASGACVGFGPAYFGITDYDYGYINFSTELTTRINKNDFYLDPLRHKINATGGYLFFVPQLLADGTNNFNIQKIVKLDINKVGSYKPLVFNIEKIFHDPDALIFHFENTINLTD